MNKIRKVIALKEKGYSNKAIAEELRLAEPTVRKLWALRRLHPDLMGKLEKGQLSLERAGQIARLPPAEQMVEKLILDGAIGPGLGQEKMPLDRQEKALAFLVNPAISEPPCPDEEIREKRRELEMLNREINHKKNSITFMNYTRDALKPLIKAEDAIRELARGGVDRAFLIELNEWLGLLRRIEEIINGAIATVQVYDVTEIPEKERSNVLCQ